MAYDTIINPDLAQLEQWYAQQQRPNRRLADLAQLTPEQLHMMQADNATGVISDPGVQFAAPQPQPQQQRLNTAVSSSGRTIDLGYAAKGGSGVSPEGYKVSYDPWADGPREVSRKQLRDGRTEVVKIHPVLDGFGRQSTKLVREIETPAYLNPAETKRLQYEKLAGEARKANLSPEEEARKVGMVEEAKTEAAKKAAAARAKIPGTIEFKRASELQKVAHGAEATKNYAVSQANEVESALAGILGVTPEELPALLGGKDGLGKAEKRTEAATGVLDVLTPTIFQNTANVEEQTERLRSLSQMMGLTALRKSGVAPGTITEREWPKFGAQLGNLSLRLGDKEFVRELANIYKKTQEMRQTGQLDYEKIVSELQGQQQPQPMQGQPTQIERGAPKANLSLQDKQAMDWAMQNRNDPRSRQIMQKLGLQ